MTSLKIGPKISVNRSEAILKSIFEVQAVILNIVHPCLKLI